MYDSLISFIRELYHSKDAIHLHPPVFVGNEKKYLNDVIDSTFVSSAGEQIYEFEQKFLEITGGSYGVAVVNGTSALHLSLLLAGVRRNTIVLTQSLTFVATCNAIRFCGAKPAFIDVDLTSAGMCPKKLTQFLEEECENRDDGRCWHKKSGLLIAACLPMHTFGFPLEAGELRAICSTKNIAMIEDAAEATGSLDNARHVGVDADFAIFSFNGNKIVTCGGGGMILTNDGEMAKKIKHMSTTAKLPHRWDFVHDQVAYNYRLPNLNAALGLAQLEMLPLFLKNKLETAKAYQKWGRGKDIAFLSGKDGTTPNFWLNCMVVGDSSEKEYVLDLTNKNNIFSRPCWTPMHMLDTNKDAVLTEMPNTQKLFDTVICLPSGIRTQDLG